MLLVELARVRGPAIYEYETQGIPASRTFILEELSDQAGMDRIRSGLRDYEKGDYVVLDDPKKMK